jgi:hypothetical protein
MPRLPTRSCKPCIIPRRRDGGAAGERRGRGQMDGRAAVGRDARHCRAARPRGHGGPAARAGAAGGGCPGHLLRARLRADPAHQAPAARGDQPGRAERAAEPGGGDRLGDRPQSPTFRRPPEQPRLRDGPDHARPLRARRLPAPPRGARFPGGDAPALEQPPQGEAARFRANHAFALARARGGCGAAGDPGRGGGRTGARLAGTPGPLHRVLPDRRQARRQRRGDHPPGRAEQRGRGAALPGARVARAKSRSPGGRDAGAARRRHEYAGRGPRPDHRGQRGGRYRGPAQSLLRRQH